MPTQLIKKCVYYTCFSHLVCFSFPHKDIHVSLTWGYCLIGVEIVGTTWTSCKWSCALNLVGQIKGPSFLVRYLMDCQIQYGKRLKGISFWLTGRVVWVNHGTFKGTEGSAEKTLIKEEKNLGLLLRTRRRWSWIAFFSFSIIW